MNDDGIDDNVFDTRVKVYKFPLNQKLSKWRRARTQVALMALLLGLSKGLCLDLIIAIGRGGNRNTVVTESTMAVNDYVTILMLPLTIWLTNTMSVRTQLSIGCFLLCSFCALFAISLGGSFFKFTDPSNPTMAKATPLIFLMCFESLIYGLGKTFCYMVGLIILLWYMTPDSRGREICTTYAIMKCGPAIGSLLLRWCFEYMGQPNIKEVYASHFESIKYTYFLILVSIGITFVLIIPFVIEESFCVVRSDAFIVQIPRWSIIFKCVGLKHFYHPSVPSRKFESKDIYFNKEATDKPQLKLKIKQEPDEFEFAAIISDDYVPPTGRLRNLVARPDDENPEWITGSLIQDDRKKTRNKFVRFLHALLSLKSLSDPFIVGNIPYWFSLKVADAWTFNHLNGNYFNTRGGVLVAFAYFIGSAFGALLLRKIVVYYDHRREVETVQMKNLRCNTSKDELYHHDHYCSNQFGQRMDGHHERQFKSQHDRSFSSSDWECSGEEYTISRSFDLESTPWIEDDVDVTPLYRVREKDFINSRDEDSEASGPLIARPRLNNLHLSSESFCLTAVYTNALLLSAAWFFSMITIYLTCNGRTDKNLDDTLFNAEAASYTESLLSWFPPQMNEEGNEVSGCKWLKEREDLSLPQCVNTGYSGYCGLDIAFGDGLVCSRDAHFNDVCIGVNAGAIFTEAIPGIMATIFHGIFKGFNTCLSIWLICQNIDERWNVLDNPALEMLDVVPCYCVYFLAYLIISTIGTMCVHVTDIAPYASYTTQGWVYLGVTYFGILMNIFNTYLRCRKRKKERKTEVAKLTKERAAEEEGIVFKSASLWHDEQHGGSGTREDQLIAIKESIVLNQ